MAPLKFILQFLLSALCLGALLVFVDTSLMGGNRIYALDRFVAGGAQLETVMAPEGPGTTTLQRAVLAQAPSTFSIPPLLSERLESGANAVNQATLIGSAFAAIKPSAGSKEALQSGFGKPSATQQKSGTRQLSSGTLGRLDRGTLGSAMRPPRFDWTRRGAQPLPVQPVFNNAIEAAPIPQSVVPVRKVTQLNQAGYDALSAGAVDEALMYFRQSLVLEPRQPLIQGQLGYILKSRGRFREAGRAFEKISALGLIAPQPGIAREASALSRALRLTAYTVWREDSQPEADISFGPSLAQSQSGLGAAYRLPIDGWASRHYLSAYTRLLWAYEPMSLRINEESFQGGIGIQVRPFEVVNFIAAAERLVSFGTQARDDWLLRGSYSAGQGYAPLNGERTWLHWSVYADAAVIDPADPDLQLTGEGRIGLGQRPFERSSFAMIPFAGLSLNYQDAGGAGTSLYEAGAGVWMRYWPGGPNLPDPLRALDLRLEYRGKLGGDSRSVSGIRLTLGVTY
ncbi:MAG: hypothetical protein AAF607_00170 [Pseudomonadota bacterium]